MPAADSNTALEALNLKKSVETPEGPQAILGGVNLTLRRSTITAMTGPNAAGKSTALRILANLDIPDAGVVHRLPSSPSRPFSAIQLQEVDECLLPWCSNLRNAAFGLEAQGMSPSEAEARVRGLLERNCLPVPLGKYPRASSGGERQMVSFLRSIVVQPDVLLLDEPFSRLNSSSLHLWWRFLLRVVKEQAMACLIVTHDLIEAAALTGASLGEILVLARPAGGSGAIITHRIPGRGIPLDKEADDRSRFQVEPAVVLALSSALDEAYAA